MSESSVPRQRWAAPEQRREHPANSRPRSLLEAIESGPLVLDAGMGSRLIALGLDAQSDDPALWNLRRRADVLAIHRRDVAAGAGAIFTNTFGANRLWLSRFGQGDAVEPINRLAVDLAREAAGTGRFVIGDIGPTAGREEGLAIEQAAVLVDAGVDGLILETYSFPDVERVLREVNDSLAASIPLLVSLWRWPDHPGPDARRLRDAGATVIGMNCQAGIQAALEFADKLDGQTGCPLLVKPSASPANQAGADPGSFAAAVPRLFDRNVRLLGGCCGTSDAHVAALASACAKLAPSLSRSRWQEDLTDGRDAVERTQADP